MLHRLAIMSNVDHKGVQSFWWHTFKMSQPKFHEGSAFERLFVHANHRVKLVD